MAYRCAREMDEGWVLKLYPRSGLGFKYRVQLNNTVGIIDSDYFHSDNEGHIFVKITNDSNERKNRMRGSRYRICAGNLCGIRDYRG